MLLFEVQFYSAKSIIIFADSRVAAANKYPEAKHIFQIEIN